MTGEPRTLTRAQLRAMQSGLRRELAYATMTRNAAYEAEILALCGLVDELAYEASGGGLVPVERLARGIIA
jgi:hypothetical protein